MLGQAIIKYPFFSWGRFLVRETQKEELKEIMKKIILSPWTLWISVELMVYGLFAIIRGIHYFVSSPVYTEGMIIAALGLGGILGRHETSIEFIRKDMGNIKEDLGNIKEDLGNIKKDVNYIKEKLEE